MLNYKYQQMKIARHYVELVQEQTILQIKVDAGCLERKKDLELANYVVGEFYCALRYTNQAQLAMDIDSYFEHYIRLNRALVYDKDFTRAEQNLKTVENMDSMNVLKDLKADCLEVEED